MQRSKDGVWLIERRKTDARGYRERTTFTGARRNIPGGWRIVRYMGAAMGTHDGAGLC